MPTDKPQTKESFFIIILLINTLTAPMILEHKSATLYAAAVLWLQMLISYFPVQLFVSSFWVSLQTKWALPYLITYIQLIRSISNKRKLPMLIYCSFLLLRWLGKHTGVLWFKSRLLWFLSEGLIACLYTHTHPNLKWQDFWPP